MVMAISPREAHRYCTLARPSSKRRDGHHKNALFGKVVSASAAALRDAKQCRHHKDLPCQGPMRSVFRTSSPPQGCRHGVGGTAIKLTDRGALLKLRLLETFCLLESFLIGMSTSTAHAVCRLRRPDRGRSYRLRR